MLSPPHTHTHTHTHTHPERERERDTHTHTETETETDRERERERLVLLYVCVPFEIKEEVVRAHCLSSGYPWQAIWPTFLQVSNSD